MRNLPNLIGLLLAINVVTGWAGEVPPDFKLADANPNSVRFGTLVSPRDYLLQVSGYYFGSAG
jgi:hypothetical protein